MAVTWNVTVQHNSRQDITSSTLDIKSLKLLTSITCMCLTYVIQNIISIKEKKKNLYYNCIPLRWYLFLKHTTVKSEKTFSGMKDHLNESAMDINHHSIVPLLPWWLQQPSPDKIVIKKKERKKKDQASSQSHAHSLPGFSAHIVLMVALMCLLAVNLCWTKISLQNVGLSCSGLLNIAYWVQTQLTSKLLILPVLTGISGPNLVPLPKYVAYERNHASHA